mgnify:FL=1
MENKNPNKPVENRREDGTFGPGNNANPVGRPKGKSLKEFWRARFAEMTDEEKLEFSQKVSSELLFRMAEGNPAQSVEGDPSKPLIVQISETIAKKHNESSSDTGSNS